MGRYRSDQAPCTRPPPTHTPPRSRQGDVQASGVTKEADALVLVRAHAGQNDEVLLTALERVHGRYLDVVVQGLLQGAVAGGDREQGMGSGDGDRSHTYTHTHLQCI